MEITKELQEKVMGNIIHRQFEIRAWDPLNRTMKYLNAYGSWIDTMEMFYKHSDWLKMQYTGRKDMHGKKIYHGDIVREVLGGKTGVIAHMNSNCFCCGGFRIVEIKDGKMMERLKHTDVGHLELIGNIFETLEK